MIPKETVVYVTRDIERALGITPNINYRIVSNQTPYGAKIQKQYPDFITLIDDGQGESAGTGDLLKRAETLEVFLQLTRAAGAKPYLLVFKNTARIEPIAKERGWTLLNPPAATAEKVENKITQVSWLREIERHLPPHRIEFMKNVSWESKPFILQWAHGHTGGGTALVSSETELAALKEKFPERRARLTSYIEGLSFTLNVVVTPEKIVPSSISYQITGKPPFTDSRFATIGNDWSLPKKLLTPEDRLWISELSREIGMKMQQDYWRGLFGIDVIKDSTTGKMHLIEINARQPASTVFESHLQEIRRTAGAAGMTTFEAHLAALLGKPLAGPLIEVDDGAQVIQRITKEIRNVSPDVLGALELSGFNTVTYPNTDDNSDLARIQSRKSIMNAHDEFNELGQAILSALR